MPELVFFRRQERHARRSEVIESLLHPGLIREARAHRESSEQENNNWNRTPFSHKRAL